MNSPAQVIFATALGASVLFHGAVYSGFKVSSLIQGRGVPITALQQKVPPKISFEFVDSPDEAIEDKEVQNTNMISNKNTRARDEQVSEKRSKRLGPAAPVVKDARQLAKKNQPNIFHQEKRGAKIPNNEFITPLDKKILQESSKIKKKEEKEKQIQKMKEELDSLEKIKTELKEKLEEKKEDLLEAQRKKVQKKREEEMSQNLMPQGNAEENRKIVVYDPSRNVDTYQAQAVQKFLSTAVDIGSASYNAQKHVLGPYLDRLKSRVAPLWHLKLDSQVTGGGFKTKKVILGIQIRSDGTLGALLVLQDFGDDLFNKLCLDTFIELAPYEPLPKEWGQKSGLNYLNLIYRFKAY